MVRHRRGGGLFTPSRLEVVDLLEQHRMLPAIHFIFSRNQCDEAAKAVLAAGTRLTSGAERDRIREIVDARLGAIDPADLAVLGYSTFLGQLEAGVAAHHAGMVPPFKEVVEACFVEGLVKVVFATETLAVGINMPAKTVVIEKLSKFTGDHHAFLTPGEYTQLTGRAGRRGMDDLGYAVVLWSPFVPFDQVAALASSRTFHLNSAFRPTYNMAANLVQVVHQRTCSPPPQPVVRPVSGRWRRRAHRGTTRSTSDPSGRPAGAGAQPVRRHRRVPAGDEGRSRNRSSGGAAARDDLVTLALMKLRPGDVIYAEKARYAGRVAVLASAHRKGGMRVTGLTARRDLVMLTALDFAEPPRALGKIQLPTDYAPNRHDFQKEVVHRLELATLVPHSRKARRPAEVSTNGSHPVEDDPELDDRLKAAAQAERVAREVEELRTRVRTRSQSVARDFDRVLRVLENWGYVDGWSADRRRQDPGEDVSRMRPADRRMSAPRSARRSRSGSSWRAWCRSSSTSIACPRRRRPRGSRRRPCASAGSESPRSATSSRRSKRKPA